MRQRKPPDKPPWALFTQQQQQPLQNLDNSDYSQSISYQSIYNNQITCSDICQKGLEVARASTKTHFCRADLETADNWSKSTESNYSQPNQYQFIYNNQAIHNNQITCADICQTGLEVACASTKTNLCQADLEVQDESQYC